YELARKGRYFDIGASFIPASIEYEKEVSSLCTTLSRDGWSVRTVEHLLLALEGTGVDNCRIEIVSSHQNDTSSEGITNNQTLAFFIRRVYVFFKCLGINENRLQFRQLPPNEMPPGAADCWVVKLKCSNGWVSCVRITDKSACAHELPVILP
ncbi:probable UDP-3-O-acyl-N-acetylglucosamine deacetylase 2, mitochondrial, partial [Tanacetum coccineum]